MVESFSNASMESQGKPSGDQTPLVMQPPKRKRRLLRKFFFVVFAVIVLGVLSSQFTTVLSQVKGNTVLPFGSDAYTLSEKISYLFRMPEVNEVVLFKPKSEIDRGNDIPYIGIIVAKSGEDYLILSGQKRPWSVKRNEITYRVYFPSLTAEELANISTNYKKLNQSPLPQATITPNVFPSTSPYSSPSSIIIKPSSSPVNFTSPQVSVKLFTVSAKGWVYQDKNCNGNQDSGENKIPGVTIRLYENPNFTLLDTISTDSEGNYYWEKQIPEGSELGIQLAAESPPYYKSNPHSGAYSIVLKSSYPQVVYYIPQVPAADIGTCFP